MRLIGSLLVIDSGAEVQDREQNQNKVVGDKSRGVPVIESYPPTQLQEKLWFNQNHNKSVKVTNQQDQRDTAHGIPGGEGLKFGVVREFAS